MDAPKTSGMSPPGRRTTRRKRRGSPRSVSTIAVLRVVSGHGYISPPFNRTGETTYALHRRSGHSWNPSAAGLQTRDGGAAWRARERAAPRAEVVDTRGTRVDRRVRVV